MTNDLSIDIKKQEERKQQAVKTYNDYTLDWYLSALSKEELKEICRKLEIKGFSSKNKEDLVSLITEEYFADDTLLRAMLNSYDSHFKVVLDTITEQKENYVVFHQDIPDDVFLFYADDTELLFIPKDVKKHFKAFKKENPAFQEEIEKIHFYRSALNLYGFVSLKHLAALKKKYYGVVTSEAEVEQELIDLMPEYAACIKDGGVKHIELAPIELDLKSLTHEKDYYVPDFDAFKRYSEHFYIERTAEIDALDTYLTENLNEEFRGTDTGKLIVNTILFGLRANETPDQILLHIDNVVETGFMTIKSRDTLTELIAAALATSRLWTLHGHKREEVATSHQVKKKPVQIKRKSKKRGKNRNIAHVAKLKSQN